VIYLAILLICVALVLGYAALRPNVFTIERSAEIAATPEEIFPLIEDFRQWPAWAPQDSSDPTLRRTYGNPAHGVGATSEWIGSPRSGQGKMTITATSPPSRITVAVDFVKPFKAHNINEFVLMPLGSVTSVTWSMHGTHVYLAKVIGIVVNMDTMMGSHFETGLARLKRLAESP
jgi:uncharacterized protein YndB with AHSA1/START domain